MAAAVEEVLQYGDWRIVYVYKRLKILHYCPGAVFSWNRAIFKKDWAPVSSLLYKGCQEIRRCQGCETAPPKEMQGFINLLSWER